MNEFQKDEKVQALKIKPIDYGKLNKLYDNFVPQKELSSEQTYFSSSFTSSEEISSGTKPSMASMPSANPMLVDLNEMENVFQKLFELLENNSKREIIFYTSPEELRLIDVCTYKDLFESVQRSRVETNYCDEVKVKVNFDEIETKIIELEHRVASLIKENEHLKLTYQILLFCDVSRPLKLWEEIWVRLSEDILDKKWKHYRYPELNMLDEQVRNNCLLEIQDLLNTHGKSLTDFKDLPQPNPKLLTNLDNRLLREALSFDANKRGTGETFLYNTIIARLRSKQMIVLDLASLGRTAHSRFVIPLELMENSTWDFRQILPAIPNAKRPEESEDEPTWIEIPKEFLIKSWTSPIEQIVAETYPDFTSRQSDDEYLTERAILTPRNDDADAINENMFKKLGGAPVTYNSADKICKASTDTTDQHDLYTVEFLNSLKFSRNAPMPSA
nr:ATP-dependent DNA helicase PIF2 [Tanacetum cinerariifolium]